MRCREWWDDVKRKRRKEGKGVRRVTRRIESRCCLRGHITFCDFRPDHNTLYTSHPLSSPPSSLDRTKTVKKQLTKMLKISPTVQTMMKRTDSPSALPRRKFSTIWGEKTTTQQAIEIDLFCLSVEQDPPRQRDVEQGMQSRQPTRQESWRRGEGEC